MIDIMAAPCYDNINHLMEIRRMRHESSDRRKNSEAMGEGSRRAALVRIAFKLLAERGFEGFRVRDVAGEAGVNIATLHYYFPTKEALVLAVVEQVQQLFAAKSPPAAVGGEAPAIEQLRQEVHTLERRLREQPELCAVIAELTMRARRSPAVQELLARIERGWRSHIAATVMRGHRDGTIRVDLDPYQAASFLASLIKGVSSQCLGGLDQPNFAGLAQEIGRWAARSEEAGTNAAKR